MLLNNKVVLLAGGAGFLGKHFDQALSRLGATVVVGDIAGDYDIELDVVSQQSVDDAFEQLLMEHGRVDTVVNCAALDPKFEKDSDKNSSKFINYPEELFRQSLDVNLLGAWRVCKAAVKQMQKQSSGNIVNVSSFYGLTPPRQELYPADTEKPVDYPVTKAGLIMLTKHIASQFGRDNIRCNALAPGGVVNNHDEEFQHKYAQHTSLGRMSTADEVADTLVFLAGDNSRGITGEVLTVDNGWVSR